jgi:hypothetical protein
LSSFMVIPSVVCTAFRCRVRLPTILAEFLAKARELCPDP